MDIRIVNNGQNQAGGVTAASVENLQKRNALSVILLNASGDIYNAGPGQGQDGAIVDGSNSSIRATVLNDATTPASSSDKALIVQFGDGVSREVGKVTVSGVTAGIGVTGDVSTIPKAGQTWPISIAADINVREQAKTGVHVSGGQVGITGDVNVIVEIGDVITIGKVTAPIGVSGDVTVIGAKFNNGGTDDGKNLGVLAAQVGAITQSYTDGRQTNLRVKTDGDLVVTLEGESIITGVTGDVSTTPKSGQTWPVSVQSGGGSGDVALVDGSDRSIKNTVRDYANSNPQAVVLTNVSGDTYSPTPKEPICATIPFNITTAGTTTLAGPYNGRVIKVVSYDLQGSSDIATAQGHFGSGASGSQLTSDWLFSVREGVAKQVSQIGGGYIFKTLLNQALVFELSAGSLRGSVTFQTGDAF